MRDGKSTKERLLLEAYKLFAAKPYDKVTFIDLERATGLSRGTILYHFNTKESLFTNVVKKYIYDRSTVISIAQNQSLSSFILSFINLCKKEKEEMTSMGISNLNFAKLNVEFSAFTLMPVIKEATHDWYHNEVKTWRNVIEHAVATEEIREDIDVEVLASMFENIYLGRSCAGTVFPKGYKINDLKAEFTLLYNLVKRQ